MLATISGNLKAVYVADLMGVILSFLALYENAWRFKEKTKENRTLLTLSLIFLIACVAEAISFTVDGHAGIFCRIVRLLSNTLTFFAGLVVGPLGVAMITTHIRMPISELHKGILKLVVILGTLVLIVNLFVPIVFKLDEQNVYSRQDAYWLYIGFMYIFLMDGIVSYFVCKRRGTITKFFPVMEFLVPLAIGLVLQTLFYGISTIWPCLTISMCGVFFSLQNEAVFNDKLTMVYNRFFLDNLSVRGSNFKDNKLTALMLDMNQFKYINDKFGHMEGDRALCTTARILQEVVGDNGTVIRYAGDEFVVLIDVQGEEHAKEYIERIRRRLEEYNQSSGKGYRISASIGYGEFDLSKQSVDEIMNAVDHKMYEDKKAYYSAEGHNRRVDS
ncbi:MAG: GGDEF domain-containing protein [Lachnospiraceae bacterium]|nr:GGDEF domain-containing protein [Lachnospiraceae bacterium]